MKTPVPMPTARQGRSELYDRYKQYLRFQHEGPPIEVLKAAKALVKEEGLNPYHAVQLHMKLAEIPEIGLHHATETLESKAATVRKRYFDYFSDLEKDQSSPKGKETEEQDLSTVKKARTTDSGGEKGDKEEKEMEALYEDAQAFLAS
ncbi:hypothetical protein BFJ72_g4709 [Fusarium proliferatum]|uniref:Uncharacterized protein n=1 Tax=Gibberella intermedia TaxID=948311 RepID=A0A420TP17_GIBIN|nr:hypothetical protein BFJ72_g4709 [Fusarium proliferatum]